MKILSYVSFRFIATITRINGRRHIRIAVDYQILKTNMNFKDNLLQCLWVTCEDEFKTMGNNNRYNLSVI